MINGAAETVNKEAEKKMSDIIRVRELEVYANHGVAPEETVLGQKYIVSCDFYVNTVQAGFTDDLSATVNWADLSIFISNFLKEHTYKLVESCANRLALALLEQYPLVEGVKLLIKKPWAPIGLPLKYVAVEIERRWHTAYIAFGSNMGDSKKYIEDAIEGLSKTPGIQVEKVSSIITTAPYGEVQQDDFLNGVCRIRTILDPDPLLNRLHELEQAAGRERKVHWGPRTLDLDVLFYDQEIIDSETLHIPHIDLQNRDFVLKPMAEIAPYLRHPVLNKTIEQLLKELKE